DQLGRDGSPQGTPIAPTPRREADGDADKDGIPDAEDACPKEPGPPDPDPKKNGCPRFTRNISGAPEIMILEPAQFGAGETHGPERSRKLLDAVAAVLKEHPEFKLVAVEGHTDNRGPRAVSVRVSEGRAKSVAAYLVRHGVAANRLVVKAYGPDRPIAD